MSGMNKISMAQIDPNGMCNSKCWFCPVAYVPNPPVGKKTMPISTFESLIQQLMDGKGDFVSDTFNFIYTAHYNEVLMYAHFEEMLDVLARYGLRTIVLSNGTPLTKKRIDMMAKYKNVVAGVCLNIPAAEATEWARLTGFKPEMFDHMIENIRYFHDTMPEYITNRMFSIQVNGMNRNSLVQSGGWLEALPDAPALDLDVEHGSLRTQVNLFKSLFPATNVYEMPSLVDRAGYLDAHNIITNKTAITKNLKRDNRRVVGCGNGIEVGGRPNGWIHVNANGDLFICCNDYDFDTVFGNINDAPLRDIWWSKRHREMVERSYNTMCTTCASAIWNK